MTALVLASDVPRKLADRMELAKVLALSGDMLPKHLRRNAGAVLLVMFAADSLGISMWTAFNHIVPVEGKVGTTADLVRALIQRAGHTFRVVATDGESATVVGIRADDPEHEHFATFTKDDAILAGLWGKNAWKSYPKALLIARATTILGRTAFADVIIGLDYTAEELGAEVDGDGIIVEVPGAPAPEQRPAGHVEPEPVDAEIVAGSIADLAVEFGEVAQ